MSEIISVDFINRKKIETYTLTPWKCIVCNNDYELDSRQEKAPSRIIVRQATRKHSEQCICKSCCVDVSNLVNKQGWNK